VSRSTALADWSGLEVIPLECEAPDAGPASDTEPRFGRWPRVMVAGMVIGGLLVLPVRANLAAGQFRRLARVWAAAESLDPARTRVIDLLQQASVADDLTHLAGGTAALEESQAARLLTLRRQLGGWLVPDHGLERLRNQMRQTLSREVVDLRMAAAALRNKAGVPGSPYSTTAMADAAGVNQQVEGLRRRFGQNPATPPRVALTGAETDLGALHRYLDHPAGTVLVTADGSRTLSLIDLDRSRTSTLDLGSDTSASQVVTRQGYVAVLVDTPAGGLVLAADPATNGPPRVLGRQATSIVPASDSDHLWVATDHNAIEVNAGATVVAGPIPIPTDATLVGATSGALYTQAAGGELFVTTLADGATRLLAAQGQLIAVGRPGVAWSAAPDTSGRGGATLDFSSDDGKTSRSLPYPINTVAPWPTTSLPALAIGPGAFSPDGRHLALWWLALVTSRRTTSVFSVVDLATARSELVPGAADDLLPQAVGWAPNGRRAFFVRGQGTTELWSYQPGAGRAEAVRVRGVTIDAMAVAGG
jgi:hypothetical protein